MRFDTFGAVRDQFPILKNCIYLDNAATQMRPEFVLKDVHDFYRHENANPYRGMYKLSENATETCDSARIAVAKKIGAESSSQIVFTRGATESLNMIACAEGEISFYGKEEWAISIDNHHSALLPFVERADANNIRVNKIIPNKNGEITPKALKKALTDKTTLVVIPHVSNVSGFPNDIEAIADIVHQIPHCALVVDACQSVGHLPIDVQEMGADYLVFSGHKIGAPMGIGVLYMSKACQDYCFPYQLGGEMVDEVHWDNFHVTDAPLKFEAGTPNMGGIVGLASAIDFRSAVGESRIRLLERELMKPLLSGLRAIPGIKVIGSPLPEFHTGIVSFVVDGVHPHDVAKILDSDNICVRAGYHCAQPYLEHLNYNGCVRASVAYYNTHEEIEKFLESMDAVRERMGLFE